MMADNNFVRRLSACETMGSATVICTDKTGTLTMNQMTVEHVIVGDEVLPVSELLEQTSPEFIDALALSIAINTTAVITDENLALGSQTECALIRLLRDALRLNINEVRSRAIIVKSFAFDQSRKVMSTFTSTNQVFVKGAPDVLLQHCQFVMNRRGHSCPLDDAMRQSLRVRIDEHCARAYRLLAICAAPVETVTPDIENVPLTLLAIASIRDALRSSTTDAILRCQRAGIRVLMITGDHLLTAEAIARECGIASSLSQSISGAELRSMSPDKLSEAVADLSVVARSSPMDKHAVVAALQHRGEVVAVTGDGTNDVAALMQADVGLAMGRSGTELAKEASDIVVLDDNFASIVAAVSWGRCIFNNVRRFLQFQLTANVVTLFISFMSAVVLHDTPFKAVQLLWVNLIMDSLGALALATGRPHEDLLARPPQRRRAPLISQFMVQNIAGQALFQVAIVATLLVFHGNIEPRSPHHYTLLFNVFVYCQMFNLVNARVVEFGDSIVAGILDNLLFTAIMVGIGIVEFCLVQFCGHLFSCVPLSAAEQLFSLGLAALSLPVGWAVRRSPESVVLKLLRPFRRFHARWTRSGAA
jgi:calcium-translocating P-type ATPase